MSEQTYPLASLSAHACTNSLRGCSSVGHGCVGVLCADSAVPFRVLLTFSIPFHSVPFRVLLTTVQLIYPLEVHDDSNVETTGNESCDQEAVVTTPTEPQLTIHDHAEAVTRDCNPEKNVPSRSQSPTKRSQRTAALEARDRIKALSLDDDDLC